MSGTQQLPARSDRLPSGLSSASLFARWLLVLAMVLAQVSAPFHHHYHDGIAAQLELGVSHELVSGAEAHADRDEHHAGSHCAIAIRVNLSRFAQPPAVDLADSAIAFNTNWQLFAALDTPAPEEWGRSRTTPDFRSHRSLPPAGRAPPLHA